MNRLFVSGALVLLAAVSTVAAEIDARWQIVVPDDDGTGVSAAIGEAGRELAKNVREATGLKLSVVTDAAYRGGAAVRLGAAAARAAGLPTEGFGTMENAIAEKGGSVYLYGLDRPGCKSAKPLAWSACVLPTIRAMTRFMEKFMDVRYVAPGETGCEVRPVERIAVPDGCLDRERPRTVYDCGRRATMMYSIANGLWGRGAAKPYGGHIYPSAFPYDKLFRTHPEYFGLVGDDRAQSQPHNPTVCISNPEVKRILVEHIAADFDAGYDVVELGQNDGGSFCQCEGCKAYGGVESAGEKFWILHRAVAEELYRTHPDKTVMIISYGPTAVPPRTFREFPPNVMIEVAGGSPEEFARWNDFRIPRGFSVYLYLWGTYQQVGLTAKRSFATLTETARRFAGRNVIGVYRCGFGELFGTEGPQYWLFNRLQQDPSADPEKLLQDYYDHAFGKASGAMKSFFTALDRPLAAVNEIESRPRNMMDMLSFVYTPATCLAMETALARAESTEGLTEKQRRRLALTRREFDYARELGRIAALYNAFRFNRSEASFAVLADAVSARNARLESFFDEKGGWRKLPGWPELLPFGGVGRGMMKRNGYGGATLNAPYTWDVRLMREKGVIPGGPAKSATAERTLAAARWHEVGGLQLDRLDYATKFRVAYDDENLYVEVEAELPESRQFESQGHDGTCYRQDCLELLIDPTGRREQSFHFIWNPVANSCREEALGLITDPLDPLFGLYDLTWDGKWSYTTERANGIWRSAVTLPFASLGVKCPEAGEKWLLNLGRETYFPGDLQVGLWNPNFEGRDLRSLEAMGTLVFSGGSPQP